MSSFPTTLSDVTFQQSLDPTYNANIYKILSGLRKSTLSIPNRLLSIKQDAEFIDTLRHHLNHYCTVDDHSPLLPVTPAQVYIPNGNNAESTHTKGWPFVPNERSGSWPLGPQVKLDSQQAYLSSSEGRPDLLPVSAYFKSTDGHVNQWSFSTRRLNLHVLDILGAAGGAVLVDTTRRGKAYPDALRRTVPIFTSVWNRLLFDELIKTGICDFQGFGLEKGEISQIESRLPAFVQDLKGLGLNLDDIKSRLGRPMRCFWISQPSHKGEWSVTFDELIVQIRSEVVKWKEIGGFNILICCSASRRVVGAEMSEEGYIQGAGDDSEGWSQGLTAKVFWENYEVLMGQVETGGDVENLAKSLVQHEKQKGGEEAAILIKPTPNMFLSAGKGAIADFDLIIDCNAPGSEVQTKVFGVGCKEGKLGSKMLRDQLPKVKEVMEKAVRKNPDAKVLTRCSTGKDLSVGVALAILCAFYDDDGAVQVGQTRYIDKQFIKQRLAWITTSKPDANPSRATLQAVNSFLMDRPG